MHGVQPSSNSLVQLMEHSNVFEYHLLTPLKILNGDVLGIYYGWTNRRFVLYNQKFTGPINLRALGKYINPPRIFLSNPDQAIEHDYPLVSIVVGM